VSISSLKPFLQLAVAAYLAFAKRNIGSSGSLNLTAVAPLPARALGIAIKIMETICPLTWLYPLANVQTLDAVKVAGMVARNFSAPRGDAKIR
jgi:hypothetical protein